jgi:outer membrane protein
VARLLAAAIAVLLLPGSAGRAETLTEALSKAYLTNPDLKAARAALDAQNELRPQALGNWLPTVTVTGRLQHQVNSNPVTPLFTRNINGSNRVDDKIVQPGINQPITTGGSEFAKLRQAEDLIRQQRAVLLQAEETVLVNAATAFMAVLADSEQLGFQTANRDRLRDTAAAIERLVRVGDRTQADLSFVRARLAQADSVVTVTRSQLEQDRAFYRQVVGDMPGSLERPEPLAVLPPRLDDALALARDSNPNVVAAAFAERAAADGVDIATAALLPSLSANASWTRDNRVTVGGFPAQRNFNLNGPYDTAFVGLQLTVPLYQAGVDYSRVRQARKAASQQRFQLDSTRNAALAATSQVWSQRVAAEAAVGFNTTQVEAAKVAVDQYQREVAAGLRTILELLDSYQQLVGAQVALSQSSQTRIVTDFQLLANIGGLTARSLALPVAYYDAKGDYHAVKWKIFGLSVTAIE